MYRKQLAKKPSPSHRSTPISKDITPRAIYGSLSSVVQRAQQDPNSVNGDERQQLESAIGTRATGEILAGKQKPWVPEFKGISAQLWGGAEGQHKGDRSIDLAPSGRGHPLPNNIVNNFTHAGYPEVAKARVHVNDAAAKSIQASAYTLGKEIVVQSNVANNPKILGHEATHVVQQNNLNVQPNVAGTPINNDPTMERNADENGDRIAQNKPVSVQLKGQQPKISASSIIQRRVIASTLPQLITEQIALQNRANNLNPNEHYTTVGFEHEFAQMTDGPLQGLTHVEVGESREEMPYTEINFKLETDAANALELVSPPFFVETIQADSSIPIAEDVAKINRMIGTALQGATITSPTIGALVETLRSSSRLNFQLYQNPSLGVEHRTPNNERRFFSKKTRKNFNIPNISIVPSSKNGGISAQANIALTGKDIGKVTELMTAPHESPIDKAAAFGKVQVAIENEILGVAQTLIRGPLTHEMLIFLRQLARTLSGIFSVPSQERQLAAKGSFHPLTPQYWKGYGSDENDKYRKKFEDARALSSYVKDVQEVWVKDTIMNFGLGLLKPQDWQIVQQILQTQSVITKLSSIEQDTSIMRDIKQQYPEAFKKERGIGAKMIAAVNQINRQIQSNNLTQQGTDVSRLNLGPRQQPSFLSHDPQYIGVRQDTYLPGDKVKLPNSDRRVHVLETRRNIDSFIDKIGTFNTSRAPLASLAPISVTANTVQDKAKLRKRYPVGSFIQYRVANNVVVNGSNNIDINCIAKVMGYRDTTLGSPYPLVVRGIEFVDATTFNLIHNDPYTYEGIYVQVDNFNAEQQARTYLRQINTIEQSDVLT